MKTKPYYYYGHNLLGSHKTTDTSSSVRPFVRSSVRPFVRSSVRPFVRSTVIPFVRLCIRPHTRSLISSQAYHCPRSSPRASEATLYLPKPPRSLEECRCREGRKYECKFFRVLQHIVPSGAPTLQSRPTKHTLQQSGIDDVYCPRVRL